MSFDLIPKQDTSRIYGSWGPGPSLVHCEQGNRRCPGTAFPTDGICCCGSVQLAPRSPEKTDQCLEMKSVISLTLAERMHLGILAEGIACLPLHNATSRETLSLLCQCIATFLFLCPWGWKEVDLVQSTVCRSVFQCRACE